MLEDYSWIKSFSKTRHPEAKLGSLLDDWTNKNSKAVAFYTDTYQAAAGAGVARLVEGGRAAKLLELRVFLPERELWIHRTSLGQDFIWRIAEDPGLEPSSEKNGKSSGFLGFLRRFLRKNEPKESESAQPSMNKLDSACFVSWQFADIDASFPVAAQPDEYGAYQYRTTVGGTYTLPIAPNREPYARLVIQIMNYVAYDENGVANVMDWRMKSLQWKILKPGAEQ